MDIRRCPGTNISGAAVSHVYAEDGVYPVTVSATSALGTVTTRAVDVEVTGGSSVVASVPDNAVWYRPAPVDQYLFRPSGGGLAASTWNGTSWRPASIPGRPDRGSGLTTLSYPDPDAGDAMTPHAYYTSGGNLTETYLAAGAGWTSRRLAGRPAAGSAIVAGARASGPEVFYFGAGGRLASSADADGTWSASGVDGPPTTRPGSLALGSTVSGPELFYLARHGIMAAVSTGSGWATAPVNSPFGVAADSPLAAVSAGAHQVNVFFIDGRGELAEAAQEQRGWRVSELPGTPARGTSLAAVSYLLGPQSTAAGPVRLGAAVYYLTRSGRPATTYAAAGRPWRSAVLPGTATAILGADAYQAAGEPSRVFLSGPSGLPGLDEARDPGGPWTAQSLVPSPVRPSPAVLWLAALCLAGSGLAALWLARRRIALWRAGRREPR